MDEDVGIGLGLMESLEWNELVCRAAVRFATACGEKVLRPADGLRPWEGLGRRALKAKARGLFVEPVEFTASALAGDIELFVPLLSPARRFIDVI